MFSHEQRARLCSICKLTHTSHAHEPCKFTDLDICFCIGHGVKYLINWPQKFYTVAQVHIVMVQCKPFILLNCNQCTHCTGENYPNPGTLAPSCTIISLMVIKTIKLAYLGGERGCFLTVKEFSKNTKK